MRLNDITLEQYSDLEIQVTYDAHVIAAEKALCSFWGSAQGTAYARQCAKAAFQLIRQNDPEAMRMFMAGAELNNYDTAAKAIADALEISLRVAENNALGALLRAYIGEEA